MFKNHKLEVKLVKNRQNETVDTTPAFTKEDVIETSKTVLKYIVGGALIVIAAGAVADTAQYAAMTRIDRKNQKED